MKPSQRQNEILTLMRALQKELKVEELAALLNVSSLTIRRDLQQLSRQRAIIRTHGGCLSISWAALETEYSRKVSLNLELKQAIGKAAVEQLKPGDALLIHDGSTTFHLASNLSSKTPLTVYTNSLAMISELGRVPAVSLYIIGGMYNPNLYSLRGSLTEYVLESLNIDVTFLGADAIDDEGRCLASSPEEASLAKCMLRSGRRKILLADHTKLNARGNVVYGTLNEFELWITTRGIGESRLQKLGQQTHIHEAEP